MCFLFYLKYMISCFLLSRPSDGEIPSVSTIKWCLPSNGELCDYNSKHLMVTFAHPCKVHKHNKWYCDILPPVGAKTQHGYRVSNFGAGRDEQHSVEHSGGDIQLWKSTGEEQEEPYPQNWRL